MKNFILFINGSFSSKEEILNFIEEKFKDINFLNNKKYIIEKDVNLIFLFSTDLPDENLSYKLKDIFKETQVSFYFLFDINNVVTATLQPELLAFLQNGKIDSYFEIIYDLNNPYNVSNKKSKSFDEDEILDKIFNSGMESLNEDEINFLKSLNN